MKILKYTALVIVILISVFFGKGLLTPSVSYECQVEVNKPANVCWAVMSDESTLPKWIDGFKRTELISGKKGDVGAVSKMYVTEGGEEVMMEETITVSIPNQKMAMNFNMDFMNMEYEMIFNEEGDKTKIITKSTTIGNGVFAKSIISFMPSAMKEQETKNLNNLKKLIEESN